MKSICASVLTIGRNIKWIFFQISLGDWAGNWFRKTHSRHESSLKLLRLESLLKSLTRDFKLSCRWRLSSFSTVLETISWLGSVLTSTGSALTLTGSTFDFLLASCRERWKRTLINQNMIVSQTRNDSSIPEENRKHSRTRQRVTPRLIRGWVAWVFLPFWTFVFFQRL